MNYEIITVEFFYGPEDHVIIAREDGSFESFPADEANPRYIQFLAKLEETK